MESSSTGVMQNNRRCSFANSINMALARPENDGVQTSASTSSLLVMPKLPAIRICQ